MMESESPPEIYTRVRATWLSRRPAKFAGLVATLSLMILTAGCVAYWNDHWGAAHWMPATQESALRQKELWRLWTTLFAHADFGHLISNSFMFFILGFLLNGYFGTYVFPVSALLMGGAINAWSLMTYSPQMKLIGASGMVSWMGGVWLTLYLFLDTKVSRAGRALRSVGVALMLFAPSEAFDPKVSYRTHAIGFLLGVAFGVLYYRSRRKELRAAEVVQVIAD